MTLEANATGAVAGITRRAADRLRAGHLWVYRSDVDRLLPARSMTDAAVVTLEEVPPGALVSVVDGRGIPLGTALYSAASEIALRMVSRQAGLGRAEYLAELRKRVREAIHLRQELVPEAFSVSGGDDACRLVFSEADGLPGIVADRYNGLVVVQ